uniref:transmembrane protein 70, mitochondrial n=1 Tax=Myxine glutinosa TaxID=7769 RepID=UPI00358EECB2
MNLCWRLKLLSTCPGYGAGLTRTLHRLTCFGTRQERAPTSRSFNRSQFKPCTTGTKPWFYRCERNAFGRAEEREDCEQLVYTGNLSKTVRGVKFFSYSCSAFTMCVMPVYLSNTGFGSNVGVALQAALATVVVFFTFVTPFVLHLLSRGYVVRLYHHRKTDTYKAVTYSAILTEKRSHFHQADVQVPGVARMFTTFRAGRRSFLVDPYAFVGPLDYAHLMGYDRPMSFKHDEDGSLVKKD